MGSGGKVTQGVWRIEDCGSTVRKGRSQVEGTSAVDNTGGAFSFNQSLIEPPVCNISVNNHFEESVDVNSTDENGWTPLHLAAWKGQLDNARLLIEKGADINAENIFGRKPVHVAAESNNTNIIEFFLSKGMNVDDTDRYGRTPLYCASWNGHLGVVKYLVEKGADINAQDKGGETSLDAATDQKHDDVVGYLKQVQLNQELLIAAQYGNFDEVRDLVSQGASLNTKYSNGMTVMHSAAYGGNLDIVKYFVADAKNSLEIKDNGSRVPLHYAAYNGKLDVVKYFIDEEKVDVNLKDSDGQTALHMASGGSHLDVVEYLASKGADIKAKDKDGKTPLDIAIDQKHDSIVKYLKQAQLNEQLLAAVKDSDFNEVQGLVNRGANVNAKDKDGKTPLHYASQSYHRLGMVKYLISKGAGIDVKDNSGGTPEDEECYTNSDTMMKVFMQAHLDKELLLTVKNEKDLKTISDLIAKDIDDRTHGGFYYTWSGNLGTVEFLVSKDVSVNATDKYGCTLLHWAALKGHSDIAKFLVDKRANVNAKDILGRTPMHFVVMNNHKDIQGVYGRGPMYTAAENNDKEIIELFLMKGAGINEADGNGETPLHLASWGGHLDVLQYLINSGANVDTKDDSGKTSLDIARDKGHNNVVEYLQQTQSSLNRQLLAAVQGGGFNEAKGLIAKGANIDTKDEDSSTLLYSAAEIGDLDRIRFLLDNGSNIESKNGEYQATPLHGAVANYRLDAVKLLLSHDANVNAEDKGHWTPLHYAAGTDRLDIVKSLVDAGANLGAKGNYGKTPLDIAKDKGHSSIVNYLKERLEEERSARRERRHLPSESLNSVASSGTRSSSWINGLCGWAKEKGGKLASDLVNGLYRGTAKELKDSKLTDIQMDSSNQWKSKQPSYDQAQEMEFQYMSKYDARKSNDKNAGAYSKKRGNDRQAKQQYGSKMGNEQSVNQSRVVGNEKQQKLGVLHNGPKPTLSHHSNKNHSYFDGQPKKISERKEHIVNYKRCDDSSYKHSNQHKPTISANNKWSERISNERIDSRKMIGGTNQKQQGFHQNQQSSHNSKHAHLTRATAQVDVPSTLFALNMLAMKATNQKFNNTPLPKKIQKGMLHAEKVRAEALGRKVGERIEGTLWFTK
ncbi:ankyrin repeat domain-containing protein [Wolbachia endosymbiont of Listronotus oregonensis]|uniref:ankyrin repeat domain-containing protein n=1 Tax=Wolbachia endosymbiont of Listronotus oregonensis TaxID=2969106 RepID=UPI0028156505|nr:ankyrin repeat domain-containing protein [Wolbachia endosymbiont of Listronotus oregonensis]WMT84150.1 ankyrin repeat domain-containing protein [Wolbachia endosymbiont of Listronotus oregonensis]